MYWDEHDRDTMMAAEEIEGPLRMEAHSLHQTLGDTAEIPDNVKGNITRLLQIFGAQPVTEAI